MEPGQVGGGIAVGGRCTSMRSVLGLSLMQRLSLV